MRLRTFEPCLPTALHRSLTVANGGNGLFFHPVWKSTSKKVAGDRIQDGGYLFAGLPHGDTFYFESFGFRM